MARADKAAAVAELAEEFRGSSAAVLTEYRGLTVSQLRDLRRALGETTTYAVVKNTLTKLAAREAGVDVLEDLLVGPSAIAFVKGDPVVAAKGLRDFARTHPLLVIKGGVVDGARIDAADLTRLADLESREVLLAKLAGAMKAKTSQAAALFQAPLAQVARTVDALRAKVEESGGAVAASGDTTTDVTAEATADATTDATAEATEEPGAEASTPSDPGDAADAADNTATDSTPI
jgi:large subunit ribosomal protein L10